MRLSKLHLITFLILSFCFTCITTKADQATDSIKLLVQESKYFEAIRKISDYKIGHILNSNLYYLEGVSFKNLYKINEAIISFQKAYQLDTFSHLSLLEMANCYKINSDYKNAVVLYEKVNKSGNDSRSIQIEISNMYFAMENYDKAKQLFQRLYLSDTSNIYVLRCLAKCFDNVNRDDSSILYYTKVLELNPYDNQTVNRLCNIYIKHKKYDDAMMISENYLKTDSLNPKINSTNAYLYLLIKDYAQSYSRLMKCYLNNDTSEFIVKYLGISCFKLDSLEPAKFFLEKAYNIDSTDYQTSFFLGVVCASHIYKQMGIYYLNKTVKLLTPDSVYLSSVYFNLGKAYDSYSKSPCEFGFDAFVKANALNPKDTMTLLFLAFKYDNCIKDKDMASMYYKQFIATRPAKKKDDKNSPYVLSYYDTAIRRLEELERK